MARPTLPDGRPTTSLLRRLVSTSPMIVGVYAATSLALGFGFGNAVVDAVGLVSTAAGYMAGDAGIRSVTRKIDGVA